MFTRERMKGFAAGVVFTTLLSGTVFAESTERMIKAVYNDVKIYVDGTLIKPVDVNGSPVEPFGFNGTTYVPARAIAEALGRSVEWDGTTKSVHIKKKDPEVKEITVENAQQLLEALGSNRKITLKAGVYNLSRAAQNYKGSSEIQWEKVYDGSQLVLNDIHNLTLQAEDGRVAEILVEPRYANVINFRNVSDVTLQGIRAGHTTDRGYCTGGVFVFEGGQNISISKSELFGCGTEGLMLSDVDTFKFIDSTITDCSYGIMTVERSRKLEFTGCKFNLNQEFDLINLYNSSDVLFNQCTITENKTAQGNYADYALFNIRQCSNILLKKSSVTNNTTQYFVRGLEQLNMEEVTLENNTFSKDPKR